ncbi:helix-turn-helix domain-containing protein [Aliiroseovarius subalbicans]|uniref:helix-turn-helix transcriptional regulator n=1 Tax=Aliiroseovarius subalbicans TaxID=2925840 RepID=UPI001F58451F|nr:helix-turn-helix domain-containing protein [Aliiroseovarius subalbicans]MCI2400409.1 helix-turn-helix domain-containing protein [Aliiroseovarius subalbicans]
MQQTQLPLPVEDPNRLMDENEAADLLCYSVRALQNWRYRGGGPKFIKISARSVRYAYGDVMEWIEQRRVANTSQAPNI